MINMELVDRDKALEVLCIHFVAMSNVLLKKGLICDVDMRAEIAALTSVVDQEQARNRERYLEGLPDGIREIIRQEIEKAEDE